MTESPLDDELAALRAIVLELEPLEWSTRRRVLRYLTDRYYAKNTYSLIRDGQDYAANTYAPNTYACGTGGQP